MPRLLRRYVRWLHTRWPAGTVEKLPEVREDGSTRVPGVYVVGDLTGIPLLKLSSDSGARVVRTILADPAFARRRTDAAVLDLVVVGAGVSGVAAMAEAVKAGLRAQIIEAAEPFSTIVNFPRRKPIYTYPSEMTPAGDLTLDDERTAVKEGLVEVLREFMRDRGITPRAARVERVRRRGGALEVVLDGGETIRAHRVVIAIGRSGNFRRLGVPGEDLDKVSNRLHDPKDFRGRRVLVVGGGDGALEIAIAIAGCGGFVTLSYRKGELSRAKPENIEAVQALARDPAAGAAIEERMSGRVTAASGSDLGPGGGTGTLRLVMPSRVKEIRADDVVVTGADGKDEVIANDQVFLALGREAPLEFFRRSGLPVRGERGFLGWAAFAAFLLFCVFLYHWKTDAGIPVHRWFEANHWFPFNLGAPDPRLAPTAADPSTLLGTIRISMESPSFYYSLAYTLCIIVFGIRRVRRRRTPYVTVQTTSLALIQILPLFLLPYVVLPWMGHNGVFDTGIGRTVADALFPATTWDLQGREYWRSVGFILAWPLMFWNVFTHQPIWAWLVIGFLQTFVIIPLLVWRWGKGAYCGWICSCGALAETMGDAHRHKMPHGPGWNRLNMLGQVFLGIATILLVLRVISWATGWDWAGTIYAAVLDGRRADGSEIGGVMRFLNFVWVDDLLWAGIFGVAFYFWFSGRVWCRFACPLAALMHIYARFSRFRILADKKKCISCNVCTSVCHQGIDVMSFANKGLPMEDPECVRCSACVQSCPTGVLQFGRVDRRTGAVLAVDRLAASPVRMVEGEGKEAPS